MKILFYFSILTTLLFACKSTNNDNAPGSSSTPDQALFSGNINGRLLKYPDSNNPVQPYCSSSIADNADSLRVNAGFSLLMHGKSLSIQFPALTFANSGKGLTDPAFLNGVKTGYYTMSRNFPSSRNVMIYYYDSSGQWIPIDDRNNSFYVASAELTTFQQKTAVKATVIFSCDLYKNVINNLNSTHMPLSGSAQIFIPKP